MAENENSSPHPGNGQLDADRLTELRAILLGPDRAQLRGLLERLADPVQQAREISRVLPAAIAIQARGGTELAESIAPIMDDALKSAVRRDPQPVADAIFPIIGPAIRRAITAAMSELVQALNQTLDQTFSLRGLKWRWESIRTGLSFAEVVLRHSLVYRVEQILLIHRETGLLLQHLTTEAGPEGAAEMVAGMLTAIQDFARDSFKAGASETLETMQVGGLTVLVEPGPSAVLAAVIRGQPPLILRAGLQAALEAIHAHYAVELSRFNGDAAPFAEARPLLQPCLAMEVSQTPRPSPWGFWVVAVAVLGLTLSWGVPRVLEQRRWERYLARVREVPGVVIVEQGRRGGKHFIYGLRDPLAEEPAALLAQTNLDPATVDTRWTPFVALDSAIILRRAATQLTPPPGVWFDFSDGVLGATGLATHEWILEARRTSRTLPGVSAFREDSLRDLGPAAVRPTVEAIEQTHLLFEIGSDQPGSAADTTISTLAAQIRTVDRAAAAAGLGVRLDIVGSTDGVGRFETNAALSRSRAERVQALLVSAGVPPSELRATGSPIASAGDEPRAELRRVSFAVSFSPLS